jgi:hypothetical protein
LGIFDNVGLSLLTAMITPAVLISACGTLIFSTSTRLARVVDRVRVLSTETERIFEGERPDFAEERLRELNVQLAFYARRSRLVQGSLTSFYVSLGLFVGATIAIGLTGFVPRMAWVPALLGIIGSVVLFAGCVLLINETRLAVAALRSEMAFTLELSRLRAARQPGREAGRMRDELEQMSDRFEQQMPGKAEPRSRA